MNPELSNKILAYLNGFPSGLTFAQIYDGVKPDSSPNLAFCRTAAGAVYEMVCDGLICCSDVFAEAPNGATREKQVLYEITHLGKMRVYGLVAKDSSTANILDVDGVPYDRKALMPVATAEKNAGEMDSLTQSQDSAYRETNQVPASQFRSAGILDVAHQGKGLQQPIDSLCVGNSGGGGNAPALSSPPSQIESLMSTVNRVAVSNRELCDCGRSATKKCACGKEVCSVHWYDADGNHTIDPKGMCGDCVSAIELQTWGEMTHGIAGRQ